MKELLQVRDIHVSYGRKKVLRGIDLNLYSGEFTALLGLNGSGKTTLLRAVCGLLKCNYGSCFAYDSKEDKFIEYLRLAERQKARLISYIPQRHSTIYATSLLDVVLMGCNPHLRLLENPGTDDRKRAITALERLGLSDRYEEDFLQLSEGQKQLVILARCIVQNSPVMLMDEPDSALDFVNRNLVLTHIRDIIHEEGKVGMITLHDPNFAMAYCDRLVLLKDGILCSDINMKTVDHCRLQQSLANIYGDIELLDNNGKFVMVSKK